MSGFCFALALEAPSLSLSLVRESALAVLREAVVLS